MSDDLKPYRAKEAAEAARVNIKSIYQAVARGDIAAFRVGKVLRIPRPAFDALLREGKIGVETITD